MITLTGIAVSPGIVWGPAALLVQDSVTLRYAVKPEHVAREIARLGAAREATRRQLERIHARVLASAGTDLAYLFQAQLLMLDDQLLVPRAEAIVSAERLNAEWAVERAFEEFSAIFMEVGDGYLRERRGDVADVVGRLRRNLRPTPHGAGEVSLVLDESSILVADELPPSIAGQLDRQRVIGLVMDAGSRTDHSAILARSLRLPAVTSLREASALTRPGVLVLVDGYSGEVVIDPDMASIDRARVKAERKWVSVPVARHLVHPASTADGVAVRFDANIELPDEIDVARANGAEGIGLFRSEFMLGGQSLESLGEQEQYEAYRNLIERMAPHSVTIRTFDVDENRMAGRAGERPPDAAAESSRGPLGLRAIRLSLSRPDVFDTQLRALARASRHGPLRVLFPFVTSVEELRQARAALANASLAVGSGPDDDHAHPIEIGAMIEVPSAALTLDLLAAEAEFFSIGTNDLIQYTLAVDRTDGRVAGLYEPLHPGVLRLVRLVMRAAARRGTPVAVCGEMAADPTALLALLGLGVTSFSMSPTLIPAAREIVREVSLDRLRPVVARALRLASARQIAAYLASAFPGLLKRSNGRIAESGAEGDNGER
ncbi:MAG: phosphoenolpyruvate--protein phosphotransferase [Acidobacteria bacterium]|nr:phosphoenolpyruvate--protein phosphotransferase [Acidobacteriota bacterium]